MDVDAALSFLEKFDEEVLCSSFEINRETCLFFFYRVVSLALGIGLTKRLSLYDLL
jgi:hypothetical protein